LQDRALADLAAYIHAQLDSSGHLVRPITANVVVGYR
jgi:hypothetical protein